MLKGAIVSVDTTGLMPTVVVFQYNPESVTRTLQPQMEGGEQGNRSETPRYTGAPVEEISVELLIDASDQLNAGDPIATSMGIYPQLSALEIIAYPSSATVIANTALMAVGTIEVVPLAAPLTLFVYGSKRVLPVKINSYSITEELHDGNLNPIRARVQASLRVLSYSDLPVMTTGYSLYLANQVAKEVMAAMGTASNVAATIGVNTQSFR